jgi:hypothetical protein
VFGDDEVSELPGDVVGPGHGTDEQVRIAEVVQKQSEDAARALK